MVASATSPDKEMEIIALQPGWAEEKPEMYWQNLKLATAQIRSKVRVDVTKVQIIGISYQMHGLVVVN